MNVYQYIKSFKEKSGNRILLATAVARSLSFLGAWIAIQLIDNSKLGNVLYAWNIISFLMPFIGLGLAQSLIRYGALIKEDTQKTALVAYVTKYGILSSLALSLITAIVCYFFPFTLQKIKLYVALFAISFTPYFMLEVIKIHLRLQHNNKAFANIEIQFSCLQFILVSLLSWYLKETGYLIAFITAPIIVSLIHLKHLKLGKIVTPRLNIKSTKFWKYGIFAGLSNVSSMLLFGIDILLIGQILEKPEAVTIFKYLSLIPMATLFLPRVLITTDFVSFTERIFDKKHIQNYIQNYLILFTGISFVYVVISILFNQEIITIFGQEFTQYTHTFSTLSIGVCGILIFRGLFGNLLSAIGLAHMNFYISSIALVINYVLNQQLIPNLGIQGAAITSALIMWTTGILSCIIFYIYYKKLLFKKSQEPR